MKAKEPILRKVVKYRNAFAALIVMFGCAAAPPLRAQFSGPAVQLPDEASKVQIMTTDRAQLESQPRDIRISPGDILTVHIFGSPDFSPAVKVSEDGSIQLPLVGVVPIAGLTVEAAEDIIAARLISAGMYKNPQVTLEVTASANQFATVTGELHALVPLIGERRLLDVLALASGGGGGGAGAGSGALTSPNLTGGGGAGFPATASHVITIIRQGEPKPIVVNLGTDPERSADANIVIQPHDLIVVSRVGLVYMIGAFARQGAIPLDQNAPLTLLEATSISGGEGFEGRFEDLRIIRTDGLKRAVVKVDIKRVLQGKDPDPILQAQDIVFLPTNLIKAALKGNGISILTSVIDVALIAIGR